MLQEQQLADVAEIFSDRGFCDEVPLYSRYRQVDFLKQYGDVDLLLMELALDYLERVISETDAGSSDRFAAITVIRDE
ncbi:MAG TPA: Imm15 family immunity protein, partial [Pirellulales bacterium]|nr:Imm15 family immunity protein [Pirellulales bacterium]